MENKSIFTSDQVEAALKIALNEAQHAALEGEVPVGAVVFNANGIIAKGRNAKETLKDPTGHAEIRAIREAAINIGTWRLTDLAVAVTLEPCPMCLGALQQARVAAVYFGAIDLKGGALSLGYQLHSDLRSNHRFPVEHVPNSECSKILSDFFKNLRT